MKKIPAYHLHINLLEQKNAEHPGPGHAGSSRTLHAPVRTSQSQHDPQWDQDSGLC